MLYNDYYLRNTPLILTQLPTAGMTILLLLVGVNAVMRRTGRRGALSPGEMMLIWAMIGVGGGIGSTGFGRAVPGYIASPAYHTTATNEFTKYLLGNLPDWMILSKDPESKAVRWFHEGLPHGESIPWGMWLRPLAAWSAFIMALWAASFALVSIFYRQWADRERLTFPIVYLPVEAVREPGEGHVFNDFLRSRVVWLGAAIPIVVFAVNGLRTYYPAIPEIRTRWDTWGWFPDRPWSAFNLGSANTYFSIVGLSFLLTTEASLSIWGFFVLYHLSYVLQAWLGAAGQGFWGNWTTNVGVFQAAGAVFALCAFLCWIARAHLRAWSRRAVAGAADPSADPIPARLALVLLVAGSLGMWGWVVVAGGSWWGAALGIGLFLCVVLALARLVVEAGLLLVGIEAIAYDFVTRIVPAQWVSGPTAATFVVLRGGLMNDLREIMMPYLLNGVRACEIVGLHARKVLAVFALTAVISLLACCFGRITTCYKYGAMQGDTWYNLMSQTYLFPDVVEFLRQPPTYEYVRAGETRVMPVTVAHLSFGAALTGLLLWLRARFLWWPLSPIGYLVCASWAVSEIWFSVLIGWMAKWSIMTFGGATAYRRALPFFLGLVLGQAVIATVWIVVSLITGRPGVYMLPD